MNLMGCGKDKATKLFRELDKDGIGLIERKKQGQGRPTRIYVKNFILPPEPGQPQQPEQTPPPPAPPDCGKSAVKTAGQCRTLDCGNSAVCTAGNARS